MSVLTPGYILEISETALLINGHSMPFSGGVEDGIEAVLEQLSQLTQSGGAPGGLGIVIKDSRPGGLGEVSRTIASGSAVTLDMFAPAGPVVRELATLTSPALPSVTAAPDHGSPALRVDPTTAASAETSTSVAARDVAPAVELPPSVVRDEASTVHPTIAPVAPSRVVPVVPVVVAPTPPIANLSPFARLAQVDGPALAATPMAAAITPVAALELPVTSQRPPEVTISGSARSEAHGASPVAPEASQRRSGLADQASASPDTADASLKRLEPAADEIDFQSIFKDDDPIIDEGIRTPIGRSTTSRQRKEGFSLKSNARIEVERRRERKRKVIYGSIAAITLVAALRIVGVVMAGPSGDYAAICVDARTMQRQPNAICSANSNPFAQTVYFGVGQAVPGVGGKAKGGTPEKPIDPRSVNTEVPEGMDGVVLDGGEVK